MPIYGQGVAAADHAAAATPPPLVRGAVAQRPSTPAARQIELEQCQVLTAPASLLRPRPGAPPSVRHSAALTAKSSPDQHRTGIMCGRLEVPLVLAFAIAGTATGDDGSPTAPAPIASLTPVAHSYGPVEAGKRAADRIVITVADSTGEPVAGASWRWQTDHYSGWVYPPDGGHGRRWPHYRHMGRRRARPWCPDADRRERRLVHNHDSRDPQHRVPSPAAERRQPGDAQRPGDRVRDRPDPAHRALRHLLRGPGLGRWVRRPAARRVTLRPSAPVLRLGHRWPRCAGHRARGRCRLRRVRR